MTQHPWTIIRPFITKVNFLFLPHFFTFLLPNSVDDELVQLWFGQSSTRSMKREVCHKYISPFKWSTSFLAMPSHSRISEYKSGKKLTEWYLNTKNWSKSTVRLTLSFCTDMTWLQNILINCMVNCISFKVIKVSSYRIFHLLRKKLYEIPKRIIAYLAQLTIHLTGKERSGGEK